MRNEATFRATDRIRPPFPAALLLLVLAPIAARAHNVDDNDASDFVDPSGRLLRVDYANDYFTGTDRYYTQGAGVQYFDPVLSRSPLMAPLFGLSGAGKSYGLLIRNDGFTPASLTPSEALIGDRPYASLIFLGHTIVSKDPERGLTLTAELDAGIIGQAAGGKSQQVAIHSAIHGNQIPLGWDNQIRNDAVLDYYLRLEKTVAAAKAADLGVYGEATAGTLYDNVDVGVMGRVGKIGGAGKTRYYLFGRAEDKLVGYDATLQGGLLNRGSPYTLTTEEVRRNVLRADAGFAADFGRWIVEADRTYLSREFTTGLSHEWVEISVSRRF